MASTLTDLTKPNREPNESGLLQCRKCGTWQAPEAFRSKQTQVVRYTDYCEECREKSRMQMRLYHDRKRRGVKVSRGRPSSRHVLYPIRMVLTLPRPLVAEVEQFANARLETFLKAEAQKLGITDFQSIVAAYGVASEAETPEMGTQPQRQPRPGSNPNSPRPRNDDEQLFRDTVGQYMRQSLEIIEGKLASGKWTPKKAWKQWDDRYQLWIRDGKRPGYNGPTKEDDKPEDVASEPAPQGQE